MVPALHAGPKIPLFEACEVSIDWVIVLALVTEEEGKSAYIALGNLNPEGASYRGQAGLHVSSDVGSVVASDTAASIVLAVVVWLLCAVPAFCVP